MRKILIVCGLLVVGGTAFISNQLVSSAHDTPIFAHIVGVEPTMLAHDVGPGPTIIRYE